MLLKSTNRYVIQKSTASDISGVMAFFAAEHDPVHPLAVSRRFVDWHYYDHKAGLYNILIAKNGPDILGLLTYVTNIFFDENISAQKKFIWINNWLAKRDFKGFVGLDLFFTLPICENCDNIGTVGPTAAAKSFYENLDYCSGRLEHYFFPNQRLDKFKILKGELLLSNPNHMLKHAALKPIIELNDLSPVLKKHIETAMPYKSLMYFENKYLKNPFYKYFAYAIELDREQLGLLIGRVITHENTNIVTIVEYCGDERYLSYISPQEIIDDHDAEYLSFYCSGIAHEHLLSAGFILNSDGNFIVPSRFEPFQYANIEITFAYKSPGPVFKGDGDRDYPRILSPQYNL